MDPNGAIQDTQVFSQEDAHMNVDIPPETSNRVWCRLITRNSDSITYELTPIEPDAEGRHNLVTIGRGTQNHICFDSCPRISNRHCMIYCKMNRVDPTNPFLEAWIEDLSANGTFLIKGQRLQKNVPRLLRTGDEISLINPDLISIPALNITEDIVRRNSFIVIVDLLNPNQQKRPATVTRRQEMIGNLQNGLIRSNTVVRLLNQQRNIYDFYDMGELLGSGAAGHVYRGIKKDTGQEWAVKVIDTRQMADQDASVVTKEAALLRSIHHPNVMRLEDIFAHDTKIFLVMELSSGGDLFERISNKSRYTEEESKHVMVYILDAMKCLHDLNIAHRDLKPENILLPHKHDDTWVKITDFGLAKVIDEKGTKTYCGTPQYFAPEVMERKYSVNHHGTYSLAADIWSCGCIMYVLLMGSFPFNGSSERALYQCIRKGRYNTQHPVYAALSAEAKDLLARFLEVDPDRRITAAQALQHPWLAELHHQYIVNRRASFSSVPSSQSNGSSGSSQPPAAAAAAAAVHGDSMLMSVVSDLPTTTAAAAAAAAAVAAPGGDGGLLMPPPMKLPGGRQPAPPHSTTEKKESVMSVLANDINAMDVMDHAKSPSPTKRGGRRSAAAAAVAEDVTSPASVLTGKRKRPADGDSESSAVGSPSPRAKRASTKKA